MPLDVVGFTPVTLAFLNFTHVLKLDLRFFRKTSLFAAKTWQDPRLYVGIDFPKFGPVLTSILHTAGVFIPTARGFQFLRFFKSYDLGARRASSVLILWGCNSGTLL